MGAGVSVCCDHTWELAGGGEDMGIVQGLLLHAHGGLLWGVLAAGGGIAAGRAPGQIALVHLHHNVQP